MTIGNALGTGVLLAAALLPAAIAAQPPQQAVQDRPAIPSRIGGKIISIAPSCSQLVLQESQSRKAVTLAVDPQKSHWSPEPPPGGCSFVAITGKKTVLKPNLQITAFYRGEETKNVLSWVALVPDRGGDICEGQGGAEQTPNTVFFMGCDGIPLVKCISCPNPSLRAPGSVLLEALVEPDGKVANVRVLRGLGKDIDAEALRAVQTWRFKPVLRPGGKAVWVVTPVVIDLSRR
jgi:TonB family protein